MAPRTVGIASSPEFAWSLVGEPLCWSWLADQPLRVRLLRRHGDRALYRIRAAGAELVCLVAADRPGWATPTRRRSGAPAGLDGMNGTAGFHGRLACVTGDPDRLDIDADERPADRALSWSVTAGSGSEAAILGWTTGPRPLPEPLAGLWERAGQLATVIEKWAGAVADARRRACAESAPPGAAAALAPLLSERAADSEAACTLDPVALAALRGAGLFRLGLPRQLGGQELPGRRIVATIEELSAADASAGWCTFIGNQSAYLAWLAEPDAIALARRAVPPEHLAGGLVLAGSTAITGQSEPLDGGGYRISGRWRFNSGCLHADLLMVGFAEPPSAPAAPVAGHTDSGLPGAGPRARLAFVPWPAATVLGTWEVGGLAGTGSHDLVLDRVAVPAAQTAPLYYAPARFGGPLHRLSPYNVQAVLMVGVPLGVARRAVGELLSLAETGLTGLSRDALLVEAVRARTALAAARALVMDTVERSWAVLEPGGRLAGGAEAELALVLRHATDTARQTVETAVRLAGAAARDAGSPLRRCLRDVYAAGQHIAVSDDVYERNARRAIAGGV